MGRADRQLVVGAAVVRHGRVLAARRTAPPAAAGRWEFPGGKVETAETPDEALRREIREELDCDVVVEHWLAGRAPIGEHHELAVAMVRLGHDAAQPGTPAGGPESTDHDLLRWVGPDDLDDLDWLEPDRPFLAELAALLRERRPRMRGIFFEADDAHAVAAQLTRDGYETLVERERLAGEDDDEDHPWAVLTDAPQFALELLVDAHEGWLDLDDDTPPPAAAPLELPTAPRRIKRP